VIEGGIEMSNVRTDLDVLLVDQGMPRDEVRSVLAARDPRIVRRHLELHRERLMERALEERGAVDRVEAALVARLRWGG
jgi:hypothetical protein